MYAHDKLAQAGIETDDLGMIARAIYGDINGDHLDKMMVELAELGHRWPSHVPADIKSAIRRR